jgi:Uncharacterized conserved protein (DUF2075)
MKAAFRCALGDFSKTSASEKLGALSAAAGESGFATQHLQQVSAWVAELEILAGCVERLAALNPGTRNWTLLLEYGIPRREKRPDVVLLADDLVFVIEFKIGAMTFESGDQWQVLSYALDLRDFHAESAGRSIVPVLVATGEISNSLDAAEFCRQAPVSVLPVQKLQTDDGISLANALFSAYETLHQHDATPIDGAAWEASRYRPSPNIIEAAETLFAGHSVAEISHSFALNLRTTSQTLVRSIETAQSGKLRTICFVTGIPGAGKTLAGLNTVHDPSIRRNDRPPAVFLSGNGPLVKIVREAITRNRVLAGADRRSAQQAVSAFIANVHTFLKLYGIERPDQAPHENAIVFDEAQRAWDSRAVFKAHKVAKSEPDLLLEIMERAPDWCVVIALVGGGQEIHRGEGGLAEWGNALNRSKTPWLVMASGEVIRGGSSVAGHKLFSGEIGGHLTLTEAPELHLDVGVRSPRANWLGNWVNSLLRGGTNLSMPSSAVPTREFPVLLTRDLRQAKDWLRQHADGAQRYGLLASSGALRLRPHGIEVSTDFRRGYRYADWFLAEPKDCRSSVWLEVAATEFECQGLELEWTCVCWGGDLSYSRKANKWVPRRFRGSSWQTVGVAAEQQFILNKYRVLLTRARRGMVIWVPQGDPNDPTRNPEELDAVAEVLERAGLPTLLLP